MKIKLIISILFCITAISCSNDDDSALIQTNNWEYLSKSRILGSHRGLLGYPENSYEGILAAIKAGYKVIEIDVARTKEGVFVVHHDATIDRCSDGQGYVKDYTFEELQQFNFGHYLGGAFPDTKISTLTEILELCKRYDVAIELDLSNDVIIPDEYTLSIYKLVKDCGMVSHTLFCGNKIKMELLLNEDPSVNIDVVLWTTDALNGVLSLREHAKIMFVTIPWTRITSGFIEEAHDNNIKVEGWTCVSKDEVASCFAIGVDYVLEESNIYIGN